MGKFTLFIVLCATICLNSVAGQQPGPPQQPQQPQQFQPQPPPQQQPMQAPPQQQQRRNILKPGDFMPEYDPLAPAFQHKPQLAYGKPALLKPPFAAASHLLKPGIQYGASYAPMKPELLKPELLFKHEIFQKPEFKQLLLSKPELLKPEFAHLLLAHMHQFLNQKLALFKPAPTFQLPYQPIPMNKYNQLPPHLSKPGLLEAELLKHKQFPSVYGELPKEHLKPDLTHLFTPIHKPEILSPSLPPQFAPNPQFESPPLNQVPQLFVPIPAVQQPAQAQPQPLPQPQQPALLPGFEFLSQLPGFANFPGLTTLPGFNLPTLPGFNLPGFPAPQQTPTLNPLQPSQPLQPLQPGLSPLQPGLSPLQPGLSPLQPGLSGLQPNPTAPTSGQIVAEEQKRGNLVVTENELSPEAAIGACLATPREPLSCGNQESDWDEVYEQHISCPLAPPRVWKCHCGFYKVPAGGKTMASTTSGQPLSPGSLIPGPAPPGQLAPAGHSAQQAPGGARASA